MHPLAKTWNLASRAIMNDQHKKLSDVYPRYRSHYRPRTRDGWLAVLSFFTLFALTQPPFVNTVANRIAPWVFGLPFLYAYLLLLYFALIGVLIWAQRRGL
jgi:hypothetical protein